MAQLLNVSGIPVYKSNMPEYPKNEILESIEKLPRWSLQDDDQKITRLNYGVIQNNTEYWDKAFPYVQKFLNELCRNELKQFNFWNITSQWFQWYEEGDFHDWHIHGDSMFSGVMYVKLPTAKNNLTFRWNKTSKISVEEGDIILFPSFLEHCVTKHKHKANRLVLAFNVNFDYKAV